MVDFSLGKSKHFYEDYPIGNYQRKLICGWIKPPARLGECVVHLEPLSVSSDALWLSCYVFDHNLCVRKTNILCFSVLAAQHEAEWESKLRDEKNQVWITRAGLAERGHPAGLCVSVWGNSRPSATCLWHTGLLHPSDRLAVGALLHQYHSGGAVRSEERTRTLRSTARRPSEVNLHHVESW